MRIFVLSLVLFANTSAMAVRAESINWNSLNGDGYVVTGNEAGLEIRVERLQKDGRVVLPRLNNVIKRLILKDAGQTLRLTQSPTQWFIGLPRGLNYPATISMETTTPPVLPKSPEVVQQRADGQLHLHARHAVVEGDKLQFEPQPHKNTVGYWVDDKAFPTWHFQLSQPNEFEVQILQGCGANQGGSQMQLAFAGSAVGSNSSIDFSVEETGHFQAFRWRTLGKISLQTGSGTVALHVRKLAKNAAMDCRAIRLIPVDSAAVQRGTVGDKPNVVVFYSDDQGTLDARCFGSRDLFTPNIDGLAHSGIKFTQAYAHAVCCPSRAMLMTGRYPQRGGVNSWTQNDMHAKRSVNMSLDEVTLAEVLRDTGYQTGLIGKWHLGAAVDSGPTKQGFDYFFGHRGGFIDNYNHHFLHGSGFHDLYRGTTELHMQGKYYPDLLVDEAESFINRNRNDPFLMFVCFNTPHYPEQADAQFDQFYIRHKAPRQSYAKFISATDERIGRILRKLEQTGLRDNTIVLFQSDNGHSVEDYKIRVDNHTSGLPKGHNYGANGGGGNTGKWQGHKGRFLEGGIRTPAVMSFPKALPTGVTRDQIVTAMDWFPTILELCDVPVPDGLRIDGKSLLPVIQSEDAPSHHKVLHWQWQSNWAVREGDWKLIRRGKNMQLFNLAEAKPEVKNHAGEDPDLVQRLSDLHTTWVEATQPGDK